MARDVLCEDSVAHEMKSKREVDIARNEKILIRYKPVLCSMRENCADETNRKKI